MIEETIALTKREVKKWVKNPFLLFMMLLQPIIWLGLFGKALNLTGLISVSPELINQLPPEVQDQIGVFLNQMISETFGGTTDYLRTWLPEYCRLLCCSRLCSAACRWCGIEDSGS